MDHRKASGRQGPQLDEKHLIRRAARHDTAALSALALRSKAHWGYDQAFMEACRDELEVTPETLAKGETWLCEDDTGLAIGFFDVRAEDGIAEVYALFVSPELIGSGVGGALWQKLESLANSMQLASIGIDSDPQALGFYQRMGATVVGEAPSGSIPGRSLPRLIKKLKS